MKLIPLTKGTSAIVDDDDYPSLSCYKWHNSIGYACRYDATRHSVYMHREILRAPIGSMVDHRNHNRLDNRRANLRVCSHQQNNQNRRSTPHSSLFKGVTKNRKKWQAQISIDGKMTYIGIFSSEIAAAKAYNTAARKIFGQFAFPHRQ